MSSLDSADNPLSVVISEPVKELDTEKKKPAKRTRSHSKKGDGKKTKREKSRSPRGVSGSDGYSTK